MVARSLDMWRPCDVRGHTLHTARSHLPSWTKSIDQALPIFELHVESIEWHWASWLQKTTALPSATEQAVNSLLSESNHLKAINKNINMLITHTYVYIYLNIYMCICMINYLYIYIYTYIIHILQGECHNTCLLPKHGLHSLQNLIQLRCMPASTRPKALSLLLHSTASVDILTPTIDIWAMSVVYSTSFKIF